MNQVTFDYQPDKEPEKQGSAAAAVPDEADTIAAAPAEAVTGNIADIETVAVPDGEEVKAAAAGDLIVIDTAPAELVKMFSVEQGLDPIIQKIKDRVNQEVFDVTTEDGRKRIGSVARQIGTAKMDLKRMGQELTEDWRKKTKAVTSETSRIEKELDALRDKVLAPREEYERIEKDRVEAHRAELAKLESATIFDAHDPSADLIEERLADIEEINARDWQEFAQAAQVPFERAKNRLTDMLTARRKYEADQAELEKLRQAEEARKQKERDDEIARQAAEKARQEAEAEAQRKADEEAARVKAEQDRLETEKREAEERAENSRKDRHENNISVMAAMLQTVTDTTPASVIAAKVSDLQEFWDRLHEREYDWQEYTERARNIHAETATGLQERLAAAVTREKAASDAAAAKAKADADAAAEKAAKDERDRIAAEQKKKDDEEAARAADLEHRKKINNDAANAIVASDRRVEGIPGVTLDQARKIIAAIALGEIPNVTIKY